MSDHFLFALGAVTLLTVLCRATALYLALVYGRKMTPALRSYQEKLSNLFVAGVGAIIALLAHG